MQPSITLPFAALFCGFAIVLAWLLQEPLRHRRVRRNKAASLEVYRRLYAGMEDRRNQAHFSYCPATHELVIDARVARMHGLDLPWPSPRADITLSGWQQLPAALRAAGWIDEALADGLKCGQPVCCEYLARLAGHPDRHVVLTAMPVPRAGLLVGVLAERART